MPDRTYLPSSISEDPDRYTQRGLHPLLIGDVLKDGRYRIVHKLGSGSFSTVWLSRDTSKNRYVSLKVLSAETPIETKELRYLRTISSSTLDHPGQQYVINLLDDFVIEGPNGRHRCLVTAVAGQRLSRNPAALGSLDQARNVGLQLSQALGYIHALDFAHGDCYPSNILMQLSNFDEWSDEDVYDCMGQPVKHNVQRVDEGPLGDAVPKYTVKAGDVSALSVKLAINKILLIDLGEAFDHSDRPAEITTPAPFAAPEIVFGGEITYAIDKWAFGCVLYEVCADHSLFKMIFGWFNDTLKDQVAMLGKPPNEIWEKWENRGKYFHEDGTPREPEGRRIKVEAYSLEQRVQNIGLPPEKRSYIQTSAKEPLTPSLQELYDLLQKVLIYDAKSRISFDEIQLHPFFKTRLTGAL